MPLALVASFAQQDSSLMTTVSANYALLKSSLVLLVPRSVTRVAVVQR